MVPRVRILVADKHGPARLQPDDARVRTVRLLGEACAWKSNLCWCNCGEAHGSGPSSFQPPAASLGRPDAGGLGHGAGRRGRRQLGGDKRDRRVAQCPALGSPTRRRAPQPCQSGRGRGSHDAASRRPGPRLSLSRAVRGRATCCCLNWRNRAVAAPQCRRLASATRVWTPTPRSCEWYPAQLHNPRGGDR
jgi:hypothetical protein